MGGEDKTPWVLSNDMDMGLGCSSVDLGTEGGIEVDYWFSTNMLPKG